MAQLPSPDPQIIRYVDADFSETEIAKARPTHIANLPDQSSGVASELADLKARVEALEDAANA